MSHNLLQKPGSLTKERAETLRKMEKIYRNPDEPSDIPLPEPSISSQFQIVDNSRSLEEFKESASIFPDASMDDDDEPSMTHRDTQNEEELEWEVDQLPGTQPNTPQHNDPGQSSGPWRDAAEYLRRTSEMPRSKRRILTPQRIRPAKRQRVDDYEEISDSDDNSDDDQIETSEQSQSNSVSITDNPVLGALLNPNTIVHFDHIMKQNTVKRISIRELNITQSELRKLIEMKVMSVPLAVVSLLKLRGTFYSVLGGFEIESGFIEQ